MTSKINEDKYQIPIDQRVKEILELGNDKIDIHDQETEIMFIL